MLKGIFTATDLKYTDQTDQRGPSDLNKFLLVGWRNKFLDQLKCVILIWTETFGLSHKQRVKWVDWLKFEMFCGGLGFQGSFEVVRYDWFVVLEFSDEFVDAFVGDFAD